jgi:hypothetical protein
MINNELQTRKQINRITQKRQIYIYVLLSKESQIKKMIYDRQNRRTHMMQLTLNYTIVENEKITRDVDNDENDDNVINENEFSKSSQTIQDRNVLRSLSRI